MTGSIIFRMGCLAVRCMSANLNGPRDLEMTFTSYDKDEVIKVREDKNLSRGFFTGYLRTNVRTLGTGPRQAERAGCAIDSDGSTIPRHRAPVGRNFMSFGNQFDCSQFLAGLLRDPVMLRYAQS